LIAIEPHDGPLAVMHYITVGRGDILPNGAEWIDEKQGWWRRPVTDALVFEQIVRAYNGNGKPSPKRYVILPEGAELPGDRDYRNAWALDGDKIVIDLERAKDLHRAKLREARAPRMAELDVQFMRALEQGKGTAAIAEQKQSLRDVTKADAINAAQTIEELKAVTLGLL
jgi:hypothetical protein